VIVTGDTQTGASAVTVGARPVMYPVPLMNVSVVEFSTLIMKLINVLLRLQPNRPCAAIVSEIVDANVVPKNVA
jgi:hypothetical protein